MTKKVKLGYTWEGKADKRDILEEDEKRGRGAKGKRVWIIQATLCTFSKCK